MALSFFKQATALLLFGSLSGCGAFAALAVPSAPPPADFVVITRHLAGAGTLLALAQRATPGLQKQGAALESADAVRVKYRLQLSNGVASLVLRQNASDVTFKVVARGPYAGELALRVAACTKLLRRAASAAPPVSTDSGAGAAATANPIGAATDTEAGPIPASPLVNPTPPSAPPNVHH
jgi:hypothetical protein